jgi:predicted amidophosphoribosyltransferase
VRELQPIAKGFSIGYEFRVCGACRVRVQKGDRFCRMCGRELKEGDKL